LYFIENEIIYFSRPNSVRLQNDRKRLAEEGAPPRLDLLVKELRKMTRQIHVAFIFDNSYGSCDTWHILMCMLNSTAVNGPKINGDWQAFSNELGLNYQQIKVREYKINNVLNSLLKLIYSTEHRKCPAWF